MISSLTLERNSC